MIPAPTYRAAGEEAGGQLRGTVGAAATQIQEGPPFAERPIDGQNGAAVGTDVHDVVIGAPVFVGPLERPPPSREGETTVFADQVP